MRATYLGSNPLTALLRCACGRRLLFDKKTWANLGSLVCDKCGGRIVYKTLRVIPIRGVRKYMNVTEAVALFSFKQTAGRDELISAYDTLVAALGRRAELHKSHDNAELSALVLDIAQRAMLDLERLCRKWEESDRRGLTY
jgi:hypothetical protein